MPGQPGLQPAVAEQQQAVRRERRQAGERRDLVEGEHPLLGAAPARKVVGHQQAGEHGQADAEDRRRSRPSARRATSRSRAGPGRSSPRASCSCAGRRSRTTGAWPSVADRLRARRRRRRSRRRARRAARARARRRRAAPPWRPPRRARVVGASAVTATRPAVGGLAGRGVDDVVGDAAVGAAPDARTDAGGRDRAAAHPQHAERAAVERVRDRGRRGAARRCRRRAGRRRS